MNIPVLDTTRLRLREHRPSDLDAYAAMWADERVVRHIGGVPLSREQSWARILQYRGMWASLGFGFWVIEERASGALIGEAGLQDMQREMAPGLGGTLECGWGLVPAAHGKGLADEAVRAVLAWADRERPGRRVACIIAPENAPSQRLAAKLGFAESDNAHYRGKQTVIWRRAVSTAAG
ncbi:MAG: GNAT family N-acetyltransferase [Rhizobiaceae bacterium]|nr:GNAT family N-acetyltransferase [Rhizobiaceae bacterium]